VKNLLMSARRVSILGFACALATAAACKSGPTPVEPAPASPGAAVTRAPFGERIGVQLYSVRNQLKADVRGTLAAVARMGFRDVEVYKTWGLTPAEFRAELDKNGLRARSLMVGFDAVEKDIATVIADARILGAGFVTVAWIPHQGDTYTAEDNERAIAVFTGAGTALRDAGIRFAYHCHGYEFHPGGIGERLFDQMIQRTPPGVVDFELDVFWAVHGGADPVAYLRRYPGRFPLLHLKDMRAGTPVGLSNGKADDEASTEIGTGTIDMAPIVRAAEAAAGDVPPSYFIEDESRAAPEQLPRSLGFLRALKP
jgi:sugar phosphate isomerase/epimerase